MNLKEYLSEKKIIVEEGLRKYLPYYEGIPVINEAVSYSLFAGGKRIRPILAIMASELFEGSTDEIMPFACSIEMIHTYSLIHDDLPAMDNDDYRRGRLTNHKVYGDAFAILAGDALLNLAFETLINAVKQNPRTEYIFAAAEISSASGMSGMIGGQCIDIYYEDKHADIETLKLMHGKKTGALLTVPLVAGAAVAGASKEDINAVREFGALIGLAFQIADDILDIEGSSEKLGKSTGSDAANQKSTFVTFYGLEKSKLLAKELVEKAKAIMDRYGEKGLLLCKLADYIIERDN
ncbi:MAG: polyprenyl synthetase family protein [Bacillota bacterium]